MIEIIPAILPKSWGELEMGLEKLAGLSPLVQIDVVKDIFGGHESLPMWEEYDFEFDIYVEPMTFVERALELGASAVVVHARHNTVRAALEVLQKNRGGEFATAVGLALRPADTPEVLQAYAGLYDYVQVMGIDHEGRQGEPYDPLVAELVRALRAAHPELLIQVDGAAAGHVAALVQAGATKLVIGSALLGADSPKAAYKALYNTANGAHR